MLATEIGLEWLRPWWLLAFIPVAILVWMAWQTKAKQGAWHTVIDPKFQSLLLGEGNNQQFTLTHKLSLMSLAVIWSLLTLILAGPTFKAVEIPAQKSQQGTVIVLDLSLSMLADDLAPNRLTQVKYKLTDLIKANPQESIGMVAYAGTAHTITPISEDNQTLLTLLPSLNPLIMPEYGSNPILGLEKANELFTGAHITEGHILWITDDIEENQLTAVYDFFQKNNYSLSILTAGTEAGGLIQIPNYGVLKDDNDSVVLAGLPAERLLKLSQSLQAPIEALRIENNQFDKLLSQTPKGATTDNQDESKLEKKPVLYPLDQGSALLILLVPLIALIYRRGWLFSFLVIGFLPLASYSPQSFAESDKSKWFEQWDELGSMFQTHDQQAFKAWNKQNYAAAEALFETPQWQASALYRLGRYEEAAKLFARDKTPKGFYNYGNALAKSGHLKGAQKAYQNALRIQPDFAEAQKNLAIVEKLLEAQNTPETDKKSGDQQQGQDSSSNETQSNQSESERSQQSSDNRSDDEQNNTQRSQPNTNNGDSNNSGSQNNAASANTSPAGKNSQSQASHLQDSLTDAIDQKLNAQRQKDNDPNNDKQAEDSSTQQASNQSEPETQNNPEDAQGSMVGNSNNSESDTENSTGKTNIGNPDANTETSDNENIDQTQLVEEDSNETLDGEQPATANNLPNQLSPAGKQSENNKAGNEQAPELETQLATDNWIQQIPDSPSLFLKRKFEYQYNQRQTNRPADETSQPAKTW
ncbi:VWA domain-containing protein [Thiomicrorhabdus indica]|uniref:VWA domain-containing protein n=1 Tax=Thiomicrorhabdus indica TaxID=2267253 RepID=UPI00102DA6AE|nr:VWA domain-containing protein [Thiomicrorhabdus indica]